MVCTLFEILSVPDAENVEFPLDITAGELLPDDAMTVSLEIGLDPVKENVEVKVPFNTVDEYDTEKSAFYSLVSFQIQYEESLNTRSLCRRNPA